MIRKLLFFAVLIVFITLQSCSKKENPTSPPQNFSNEQIDKFIEEQIIQHNTTFNWEWASDEMLWSAIQNSGELVAIGYKPSRATIDDSNIFNATKDDNWKDAKKQIVNMIIESERKVVPADYFKGFTMGDELDFINAFYIKIKNIETLKLLRASNMVRYVYPSDYSFEDHKSINRSDSGCDGYTAETLTAGLDYITISPGCKQSWDFAAKSVPAAWNLATGAGVTAMVIDAGFSINQPLMTSSGFASGSSNASRTISLISRYPATLNFWGTTVTSWTTTPYTTCGHGTAMLGALAAPRNNVQSSVGIAYNCNIIGVRASEDVVISNNKEELGVAASLNLAATTASVKVVSMSLGSITTRQVIGDALIAATNAGKLVFCAAGTSTSFLNWWGVIYPANMSQAQAVTGRDTGGSECDVCHTGSEVDFTSQMERTSDNRHPLTLAVTVSPNGNYPSTVGGSSVATAQTAGIATLVWSRNTSQNSTQVFNRMKNAGSFYPTKSTSYGWGNVNVYNAANF
jgi:subtilisin family serine protease